MALTKGVSLIVIDYLQRITGEERNNKWTVTREREVAGMVAEIKSIAMDLNVPIILLSQLSRATESRESKIPALSDLRESGSIEQDADIVMFLWRDPDINGERNAILNWCVDKHRGGALGGGKLVYVPNSAKIIPYYEDEQREKYGGKLPF